uniref:CCHC-type domain-containing protein n=1 Tax=Lepisosteus oculatus TaxID=7918 RepID=W5N4P4_LEPOC
ERSVILHMFDPFVPDSDVMTFLRRYIDVLAPPRIIMDLYKVWTGKRQYHIELRPDNRSRDGFAHPPATFAISPGRGYLFYGNQPPFCRKCRESGHREAECNATECRKCHQQGHQSGMPAVSPDSPISQDFPGKEPLFARELRSLIIHMYNPHVPDDIVTFLRRFVDVQGGGQKVVDEERIWTFKRRYLVRLRQSPTTPGGVLHPPANFTIGPNRGYLIYSGQPQTCRRCGRRHLGAECSTEVCRRCGRTGHVAIACTYQQLCNLCREPGNLYRVCPNKTRSFASVV